MKKILSLYIVLFFGSTVSYSQNKYVTERIDIHNSCVTAKPVCSEAKILQLFVNKDSCELNLSPQYFKINFSDSGTIRLKTAYHTGTYTLYGPIENYGTSACQAIALGHVEERTDSLTGNDMYIAHKQGFYILKVSVDCINIHDAPTTSRNYQMSSRDTEMNYAVYIDVSASSKVTDCKQEPNCLDCIGSFSPNSGKYIISGWVKGASSNRNSSYVNPSIKVSFAGHSLDSIFNPSGVIIDDWQKIEGVVIIPENATDINIELNCKSGKCYFDDIRFVPIDGSMKSYVYDPVNLRLVAELDERNYATFYEYDEEGKLIRVKKETEKGIMTIQENRNNIIKR